MPPTIQNFNPTKRVLFSNQQCRTQTALVNLYPNEYTQEY